MELVRIRERHGAGPIIGAPRVAGPVWWPVPGGRPAVLTPASHCVPMPMPPPHDVVRRGKAEDLDPMTRG
jgi:hypothetical protein